MSQALTKIKPVLVEDARMNFTGQETLPFGVQKSCMQNSWVRVPSTAYSDSSINITANPPSMNIAMNRNVMLEVTFNVDITVSAAQAINPWFNLPSGALAPAYMPISQVTNSMSAIINGNTITQNNYQLVNAFAHYGRDNYSGNTNTSLAPNMPDFFQDYSDPDIVPGYGVVADPLQAIGQSVGQLSNRGSWERTALAGNSTTRAVFSFTSVESLLMSPFLTGTDQETAFIGVQAFQLTANLQNLQNAMSIVVSRLTGGATVSSLAVTIGGAALYCNYLTPPQSEVIPKSISYSYYQTQVYETAVGNIASGAIATVSTQNIQLTNVPNRIYVFARRRDADTTAYTSKVFAGMNKCSFNWDNRQGILSSANSQILYQIARKNGYNKSYQQWKTWTGAVACFDVVTDIALVNEAETASVATTKQLQITAELENISGSTVNYTLYVVTVADGLFTIADNSSYQSSSVLTPEDVISAKMEPLSIEPKIEAGDAYGGGFFDKVKAAAKTGLKMAKDTGAISKLALLSGNPLLASAAASQGYGLVGGAKMPKGKLRLKN